MKLCMHKGPCGGARYYCLFCITPSYSSVFLWFTECPPSCYSIIFALHCTVCSFPTVTSFLQLIFFTLIDRAVVSQLWQIAVPTARSQRVLYLCLGSDALSLYPEVFSLSCFTTTAYASMSKHRLRFSYWIFCSQPVRQSRQRVSLCLVAAATSCYSPPVLFCCFFGFWHSLGSHRDDWHDVSP